MTVQFSILTVCTGNIHRSPLAACLLETWAHWYLPASLALDVRVSSAGIAAPEGARMGRRAQAIARSFGADGSGHTARPVTDDLIAASDLVLVATREQRDLLLARVPAGLRKTFTIREAGRIAASLSAPPARPTKLQDLSRVVARLADGRGTLPSGDSDDIIDPQGRGDAAYLQMVREEVIPLAHLGVTLLGMPRPDLDAYIAAAEDQKALTERIAEAGKR